MVTGEKIIEIMEEEGISFLRLQFTDVYGNLKNLAVTPRQIDRVLQNKYTFESEAMFGERGDHDDRFCLHPDLNTFVILPWRPQQGKVAKMLCDVYTTDGKVLSESPRSVLKRVLSEAEKEGYTVFADPECEFFLFHTDENGIPTTVTHEQGGLMDVGPMDFGENARRNIVLSLEEMGFEVESSHHEKAPAQHEIVFKENEALRCADMITNFKFAVRSIAKSYGLYATFMPKPKINQPGSCMHTFITLLKDGKNVFGQGSEMTYEASCFMGGILEHIDAICAITNPNVNSYKRLMPGTDAPSYKSWSNHGEKAAVKLCCYGDDNRVELRFPDPSSNIYLALATCIAAGLEGIKKGREVKEEEMMDNIDTEAFLKKGNIFSSQKNLLPMSLRVATDALYADSLLRSVLGDALTDILVEQKYKEWNEFAYQVTDWEISKYLPYM